MNSNHETPELIWDNGTRAEMLNFVETHATDVHATVRSLFISCSNMLAVFVEIS